MPLPYLILCFQLFPRFISPFSASSYFLSILNNLPFSLHLLIDLVIYKHYQIEDIKNNGAVLGKVRTLGNQDFSRSSELPFGIPSGPIRKNGKARLSAQEIMQGNYNEFDNMPDRDLGVSLTPGFRNTDFLVRN